MQMASMIYVALGQFHGDIVYVPGSRCNVHCHKPVELRLNTPTTLCKLHPTLLINRACT